ncbi:hypothetical protein SAMN03159496_06226 [Rhizobium sp. NFR07]|uniref:hypothetical protein n=1 Tax=Rhizobium sp. NFR07 TaxID=1566262 RepID=UPI0008E085FC|nr:hypothetical protein [Rhizobium sp. NFR07]SFB63381.1 hypothetical protein SAMN03159496_06226 [Rhizobium sp. NFR07]
MLEVGFTAGRIRDPDRSDWSGKAARPLFWSAWYPTDDAGGAPSLFENASQSIFIPDVSINNAVPASGMPAFPVLLFSCCLTERVGPQPALHGWLEVWRGGVFS